MTVTAREVARDKVVVEVVGRDGGPVLEVGWQPVALPVPEPKPAESPPEKDPEQPPRKKRVG